MAKRRKDPLEEIIPAVGALVCLGIFFVPGFKAYLNWGLGFLFVCLTSFLIYVLLKRNRSIQRIDYPSASEFTTETGTQRHTIPELGLPQKLRAIDWFQFEKLVEAIYQSKGYAVTRIGGANPDGGVDLIVEDAAEKFVVQCKQWKSWKVGVKQMREFLGTVTDSGIYKGVFITLQGYTVEAELLAAKHGIKLLGERELIDLLEQSNWKYKPAIISALDHETKRCPKCESEMILRTAGKGKNVGGKFWGCSNYPRCRFILSM